MSGLEHATGRWYVIRIQDGEAVSTHRTEAAAVRAAARRGEGYTVRHAGRGGPRKDPEGRKAYLQIRVAEKRKARWERAAAGAGQTLTDWITEACDRRSSDE